MSEITYFNKIAIGGSKSMCRIDDSFQEWAGGFKDGVTRNVKEYSRYVYLHLQTGMINDHIIPHSFSL